ncbi:MAG: methylenetetrahydrofolate reductase C-terminal domain-containing protein [Candidatus Saelkia tenebricola]|nr:methylenetetrahydrofolate reductase C-terminal domain-containing protein [Candidatus Saelkia tenebricola]
MIITQQKGFDEIIKHLKSGSKVFIVGCGECSTVCQAGGEKEVLDMKKKLQDSGYIVVGYAIPQAPCIATHVKLMLVKHKKEIENTDEILVLTCGLGVQSLIENMKCFIPVHVGCNTLFIGTVDSGAKEFFEVCSACGDCTLEYTAGICAYTQCPKSILNGPCGGMEGGMCEVDKEKDCVWVLIYNKLKEQGRLDLMEKIYPAKDFSKHRKPLRRILK